MWVQFPHRFSGIAIQYINKGAGFMDTRKLDMIFFMSLETNKNLTYEQIEIIANKYSAKAIYKYWQHMKRTI